MVGDRGRDEGGGKDDLCVSLIKVRESCAMSSASLSCPDLSESSGKTESRRLEISQDAVDGQQCPVCLTVPWLHSTRLCWVLLPAR